MNGKPSRVRSPIVCVCLALATVSAWGQEGGQRATLRVYLPPDARLTIDGRESKQTGPLRRFSTPALAPDKSYHYTFVCTYERGGKTIRREEVVHFRAGDDKEVDLREQRKPLDTDTGKGKDANARKSDDEVGKKDDAKELDPEVDVLFVETPQDVVEKMLELAAVKKDDVVYDLGCGDGRIVVTAAKNYGCKAVGFDIHPQRIKDSLANVKKNGVEKLVTIERKNFFEVDLKPATVVTLYLLPNVNVKLIPQLEKLKPGSRIVSHSFSMKGIKPKKMVQVESKDGEKHTLYLWETPLEKE